VLNRGDRLNGIRQVQMKLKDTLHIVLVLLACTLSGCSSQSLQPKPVIATPAPAAVHIFLGDFKREPPKGFDLVRLSQELRRNPKAREIIISWHLSEGYTGQNGKNRVSFKRLKNGKGDLNLEYIPDYDVPGDITYTWSGGGGITCESNIHKWARKFAELARRPRAFFKWWDNVKFDEPATCPP
jgi:hypothetical protein